jgi:hypothetical protein
MSQPTILASFAGEEDLLTAVSGIVKSDCDIVDIYTPYPVHGLEHVLGWPRSRLSVACFVGGAAGVILAAWFQFWATATDWPLNVGGRPWNSLPAFVPVIFECMVLLAGFSLVFAWFIRSGLYPGKKAPLSLAGATDDRFVLELRRPGSDADRTTLREWLQNCHAVELQEREEEKPS